MAFLLRNIKVGSAARYVTTTTASRTLLGSNHDGYVPGPQSQSSDLPACGRAPSGSLLSSCGYNGGLHFLRQLHTTSPSLSSKMVKFTVISGDTTKELEGRIGDTVYDVIHDKFTPEISGFGACEGCISCSTCHVTISDSHYNIVSKVIKTEEEDILDTVRDLKETSRLCCQVYLTEEAEGMTVFVPELRTDARDLA